MSNPEVPPEGFLFFSLLYKKETDLLFIKESFGDYSNKFTPSFTPSLSYYEKEMGEGIKREILFYETLLSQENFIAIKLKAHELEKKLSIEGKRLINIDPGFITMDQMYLSTFKLAPFRLYHSSGIYLDLQYLFFSGSFTPTPWCYPDYAHAEKITEFNKIRQNLKKLRSL